MMSLLVYFIDFLKMILKQLRIMIGYLEMVLNNRSFLVRQNHNTMELTTLRYTARDLYSIKGVNLVKYLLHLQQEGDKIYVQYPGKKLVKVNL